jgi:hypothetical protein
MSEQKKSILKNYTVKCDHRRQNSSGENIPGDYIFSFETTNAVSVIIYINEEIMHKPNGSTIKNDGSKITFQLREEDNASGAKFFTYKIKGKNDVPINLNYGFYLPENNPNLLELEVGAKVRQPSGDINGGG